MAVARPHTSAVSVPHRVDPLSALYPAIEPYHLGRLAVDARHDLYFEQSGNPNGKPVVFLHGGPGGGTDPKHRRFFDPNHYRIILFDQRGCGQSEPFASLEDNTTWHLVDDIEALRVHLGIEKWQVFGGSWGSTLGVAYAEAHPARVTELILRGIFMFTDREAEWFYGRGTRILFPDAWDAFVAVIPPAERGDLIAAYYARLTGDDPQVRIEAARAWSVWEASTSFLLQRPDFIANAAPGVKEILTIGKLAWEVKERHYDLVVVDSVASGHIVGQLTAPQGINELVQVGMVRNQTQWMLDILTDPAQTGVVIVSAPEEMPVAETIELADRLGTETKVDLAAVVVNRVLPELFTEREEALFESLRTPRRLDALSAAVDGDVTPVFDAAELAVTLRRTRAEHLATLRRALDPALPMLYVPYLFTRTHGARATRRVAELLGEEL